MTGHSAALKVLSHTLSLLTVTRVLCGKWYYVHCISEEETQEDEDYEM